MAKKIDPWQAESDAYALVRHSEICSNPTRLAAAKKVLKKQSSDIDQALGTKEVKKSSSSSVMRGKRPDYI